MKALFGFLFILLGVILILLQIEIFIFQENLSAGGLILMFIFTIGSLIFGGSLVYLDKIKQIADQSAAALSLFVCIGLISLMSFLVITKNPQITPIEYTIMIIYTVIAGVYGFVGVI